MNLMKYKSISIEIMKRAKKIGIYENNSIKLTHKRSNNLRGL